LRGTKNPKRKITAFYWPNCPDEVWPVARA
jgi:hypothetical protein